MNPARCSLLACIICLSSLTALADDARPEFSSDQLEFFEKKIRPIFVEHCHECHSGDEPESNLRLTSRAAVLRGGDTGPAVVPGELEEGELLLAVSYDPDGYQMPPDGKLPDETIALLREWVAMGAPWPDEPDVAAATNNEFDFAGRAERFSFQPLRHVQPPEVANPAWTRTPVDRFLLAKLEEAGLTPAPATDRRTWIRRAYFDTIGLPPTSEQVQAFLDDDAPGAYERVVDSLLASPHFGERWSRHWLDLVRYAESRGHEFDYDVGNPWHYRDYVIRATNDDVPYDQFVVEHVAGDLLQARGGREPADSALHQQTPYPLRLDPETGASESILGTGFWYLGEWVHSPVDIRQEEADRFENMIDVYSKTFLGLTVACARCHDHKFDPIRQADFYALQGYLQSSSYRQARFETMEHNRRVAENLEQLREEAAPVLLRTFAEIVQPTIDRLDEYLLAAQQAIELGPEFRSEVGEIIFEDFEDGTYDGWEVTGDSFGSGPQTQETIAAYQGNVKAAGTFFVNSHQKRDNGQGDRCVGTLTSREFTIERNYIRFLIGGGAHEGKTCVNLLIDGNPVLSTTGRNSNEMFAVTWDVRPYNSQTARIQVVDDERGGWGNVGADQFVFSDTASVGESSATAGSFTQGFRDSVEAIADERGLDAALLLNWVAHLLNAADDERDPFYAWALLCASKLEDGSSFRSTFSRYKPQHTREFEDSISETGIVGIALLPNQRLYESSPPFDCLVELTNDPEQPLTRIVGNGETRVNPPFAAIDLAPGTMDEAVKLAGWRRAGRALSSETFEISNDHLYCLVQGGWNTYVSVDSHVLINGPLHGSLLKEHPATADWHWIEHDVSRYRGHRAHLELIPTSGKDCAVEMVWQGAAPPWQEVSLHDIRGHLADFGDDEITAASLSAAYRDVFLRAPASVRWLDVPFKIGGAYHFEEVDWAIHHPHLFGLDTDDSRQRFADVSTPFIERRREIISQIRPVSATAPCMFDGSGEDEYIFIRGAWKKRGETVPRRFLEVFNGHGPDDGQEGSGRLDLAFQMVDPEQTPILPRVIVNRIWQHYFGRGIVPTPDDFGHMGQEPSHPELLDWLANELIRHDWSLKHIHRQILLSAAYRMESAVAGGGESNQPADAGRSPEEIDPQNVLLYRMNVKRLEGEIIRDAVLCVSGRLDEDMYGRSVPVHLTPFMDGRGRPGESGPVDGRGRRSLYIAVRRNFAEPFFQAFDFPNPHTTAGRRSVSNVPAQALALMNNPLIVQQARVWAERLLAETPDSTKSERVTELYETAFSRPPTQEELSAGTGFVETQAREYNTGTEDVRVWSDYCHVLMNVKEFVFVQ